MKTSRVPSPKLDRRRFLARSSAAVVVGSLFPSPSHGQAPNLQKPAVLGGLKSVRSVSKPGKRWGDAEKQRLNALIEQDTLFYWKGPQTTQFIERFRQVCPLKHVMTCSSGTAALHIAVAAAGIAPGDEVITAPITDIGTVIGVIYQLAVPVFADLNPSDYTLDPASVERLITPRTRAIIAVHLCGNPCNLTALRAIADRHQLVLIEDCAQAWGSRYQGRPIGTLGHIACFSLQNSKHITCGDGGVVASSDERFGPALQKFGDKGYDRIQGGLFESFAPNYRMTEAQAAIATAQLDRLEGIVERRSRLGDLLTQQIEGLPGILPHAVRLGDRCNYWFYYFRLDPAKFSCTRAEFVKALAAEGASASAGYIPVPLHRNPVFQKHGFFAGRWPIRESGLTSMDYTRVQTPEAEAILSTGIRIGLHEFMSEQEVEETAQAIRKLARHYRKPGV